MGQHINKTFGPFEKVSGIFWEIKKSEDFIIFTLSESFLNLGSMPVYFETMRALTRSYSATQLYIFLAHSARTAPLGGRKITWHDLALRLDRYCKRANARRAQLITERWLGIIRIHYQDLNIEVHKNGLLLLRSPSHVPPKSPVDKPVNIESYPRID